MFSTISSAESQDVRIVAFNQGCQHPRETRKLYAYVFPANDNRILLALPSAALKPLAELDNLLDKGLLITLDIEEQKRLIASPVRSIFSLDERLVLLDLRVIEISIIEFLRASGWKALQGRRTFKFHDKRVFK